MHNVSACEWRAIGNACLIHCCVCRQHEFPTMDTDSVIKTCDVISVWQTIVVHDTFMCIARFDRQTVQELELCRYCPDS